MRFSEGDTKREVVFGIHMDVLNRTTKTPLNAQELFLSSKDLMPEMEDRWYLDGLNDIF